MLSIFVQTNFHGFKVRGGGEPRNLFDDEIFPIYGTLSLCRLEVAALHFNENSNHEQAVTKEGEEQYGVVFPKYKKGVTLSERL